MQLPEAFSGRIAVFGDSSFVDDAGRPAAAGDDHSGLRGFWMMEDVLAFLTGDLRAEEVHPRSARKLLEPMMLMTEEIVPRRLNIPTLLRFSKVLHRRQNGETASCGVPLPWTAGRPGKKPVDWEKLRAANVAKENLEPSIQDIAFAGSFLNQGKRVNKWFGIFRDPIFVMFLVVVFLGFAYLVYSQMQDERRKVADRDKFMNSL